MNYIAAALVCIAIAACSSTNANPDASADAGEKLPASCAVFHDLCVNNAGLSAAAHECHEFMHNEKLTEALCASKKDACLAACTPLDGGVADATSDSSATDASTDAPTCKPSNAACSSDSECCSKHCHSDHCH